MTTLNEASRQWASRPDDERFTSLLDMQSHFETIRAQSRGAVNEASAIWQARWGGRAAERRAANSPWEPKP